MLLVVNTSEGEYESYCECVDFIIDINSNKTGDELSQEYLEYSWKMVAAATGINIDNTKRSNKERKEWGNVIAKFFKEYTFKHFLIEKYEGKLLEFTTTCI